MKVAGEFARGSRSLLARLGALAVALVVSACHKQPLPPGAPELAARMHAGKFSRAGMAYDLPYRLFVPQAYAPARRYPLIVVLHPSGSNGTDNVRQLTPAVGVLLDRAQALEPTFVLVPQAPDGDKWVSGGSGPPFFNYRQTDLPQSPA